MNAEKLVQSRLAPHGRRPNEPLVREVFEVKGARRQQLYVLIGCLAAGALLVIGLVVPWSHGLLLAAMAIPVAYGCLVAARALLGPPTLQLRVTEQGLAWMHEGTSIAWDRVADVRVRPDGGVDLVDGMGNQLVEVPACLEGCEEVLARVREHVAPRLATTTELPFVAHRRVWPWAGAAFPPLLTLLMLGLMVADFAHAGSPRFAATFGGMMLAVAAVTWLRAPHSLQINRDGITLGYPGRTRRIALRTVVDAALGLVAVNDERRIAVRVIHDGQRTTDLGVLGSLAAMMAIERARDEHGPYRTTASRSSKTFSRPK